MENLDKLKYLRNQLKIISNKYNFDCLEQKKIYLKQLDYKNDLYQALSNIDYTIKESYKFLVTSFFAMVVTYVFNSDQIFILIFVIIFIYSTIMFLYAKSKYNSLYTEFKDIKELTESAAIGYILICDDKEKLLNILKETCNTIDLNDELMAKEYLDELPNKINKLRLRCEDLSSIK